MLIDPKGNTPIYRQIVEQTRDAVEAGVYRAGEALPSLRALAVEIRVNPNTVQRAYDELERLGIIESRRGVGVFVVDRGGKVARGKQEKEIIGILQQGVSAGLEKSVSPTRIRELFESALNASLTKAKKRR